VQYNTVIPATVISRCPEFTEQYNVVMAFMGTAAVIKWQYEPIGHLSSRLDLPENGVIDQGFLSI
jgi:hypothetical protein